MHMFFNNKLIIMVTVSCILCILYILFFPVLSCPVLSCPVLSCPDGVYLISYLLIYTHAGPLQNVTFSICIFIRTSFLIAFYTGLKVNCLVGGDNFTSVSLLKWHFFTNTISE